MDSKSKICIATKTDSGDILVTDERGSMIDMINPGGNVVSVSVNGMTVITVRESAGMSRCTDVWDCSSGHASHVTTY